MTPAYAASETDRRLANVVSWGVIDSVDHAAARARVKLDDELVTDDLPWMELRAGQVRTWSPPSVGEQVLVLAASGELAAGVILRGVNSDAHPAPSALEHLTRSIWADGALDDYDDQAHQRIIEVPAGGRVIVRIAGGGSITLEGDVATVRAASVLLGPDGDRKAVARVGDMVRVTYGSSAGLHPIETGSPAVKAS